MHNRLHTALSPAAMLVAILALVLAGAGIGYTAGTIGTSDLKNNAVTTQKVKNGTLKAADMKKEAKYAAPTLGNGVEGDCLWTEAADVIPGLAPVGSRKDRFGTTHLSGIVIGADGPGGDAACGGGSSADTVGDYTAFTLPLAQRPAVSLYRVLDGGSTLLIIGGAGGLDLGGGTFIPHGAILCAGSTLTCFLDGIAMETSSAKVNARSAPGRITPQGRQMIMKFLQK